MSKNFLGNGPRAPDVGFKPKSIHFCFCQVIFTTLQVDFGSFQSKKRGCKSAWSLFLWPLTEPRWAQNLGKFQLICLSSSWYIFIHPQGISRVVASAGRDSIKKERFRNVCESIAPQRCQLGPVTSSKWGYGDPISRVKTPVTHLQAIYGAR